MDTSGRPTVALPETRQLDILAQLLERRDIAVVRCPMVAIKDSPHTDAVVAWVQRLIDEPMDLLLIYTGEGVQRLLGFAERAGIKERFVTALDATALLTRGPKPVRALRTLGIRPTYQAAAPTTAGVIETLEQIDLTEKRVGVQLYGQDPNRPLMEYLIGRGVEPDCVAPYVYASESDDAEVVALIGALGTPAIDAIAFTSQSQVDRLIDVAERHGLTEQLQQALGGLVVAAVGPVVARQLGELGVDVDVMPDEDFFMKPLVTRLVARLGGAAS